MVVHLLDKSVNLLPAKIFAILLLFLHFLEQGSATPPPAELTPVDYATDESWFVHAVQVGIAVLVLSVADARA